jgi:hypothetical protein
MLPSPIRIILTYISQLVNDEGDIWEYIYTFTLPNLKYDILIEYN